jgi:hypothetical protein
MLLLKPSTIFTTVFAKIATRYKLRLFGLDDEDKTAPTANEAALVEESGCDEIGDKKDSKLSTDHA